MEEALTALLLADAGLSALVADRVHWRMLPASVKARPYVSLQVISSPDDYDLQGRSEVSEWRLQADIWAESYGGVVSVERALRDLMAGYLGEASGIRFHSVFVENGRDKSVKDATDAKLFGRSVDLMVSWSAIA